MDHDVFRSSQEDSAHSRRTALKGLAGGAIAAAGVIGLSANAGAQPTPVATPVVTNDILQQWAAGWSMVSDPSILLGVITDDVIFEDVAAGDLLVGSDALAELLAGVVVAIPDFTITLQTSQWSGQMAAAEYLISGTQTGDLPYLAATGKAFSIRASSVFGLEGGLIRRESRYYDMVQFLTQLGALNDETVSQLGTPATEPGGGQ
jgi:steroid delta-isomerase-like uncharacterized protein